MYYHTDIYSLCYFYKSSVKFMQDTSELPTIANDEVIGDKQSERLTAGCNVAIIMQHKDHFNHFSTEDSAAF